MSARDHVAAIRSEWRAGRADVRRDPRPRVTTAWRVGTWPYAAGYVAHMIGRRP